MCSAISTRLPITQPEPFISLVPTGCQRRRSATLSWSSNGLSDVDATTEKLHRPLGHMVRFRCFMEHEFQARIKFDVLLNAFELGVCVDHRRAREMFDNIVLVIVRLVCRKGQAMGLRRTI